MKYLILSLSLFLMLWIGFGPSASGKSSVKKARYSHKGGHSHGESHSHDHGAHAHSPFTLSLGMNVAFSPSSSSSESAEGGEAAGDHSGHSHALTERDYSLLGEGHDHGSGGEEGGGSEEGGSSSPDPIFSTSLGYKLSSAWSTNVGIGYGLRAGLNDPTVGLGYTYKLNKKASLGTTLSASAPISQASSDNFKITTLSLGSGPTWRLGAFTVGTKASLAKSFYSKTVIVEEDEHEHAASLSSSTIPKLGLVAEEEEGHEHGDEEEGTAEGATGDREFDRYSLNSNLGYRLSSLFQFGTGFGASHVTHQFGESTIETNATVVSGTVTWKSVATSAAFLMSGSDTSLSAPDTPGFTLGVMYVYE